MRAESVRRARIVGAMRAAVGVGMIVAPGALDRPRGAAESRGRFILLTRTIGIRDLALGLGTLAAARSDSPSVRRWLHAGLLSDALDVVTGATAVPLVGRGAALIAGGLPVPFVLADLWALEAARHAAP